MLDLHRLRLLRELKHRGTLAAVATALSYSPSAISQQLALLESEVGVPLLEPSGRRVRLTAQAEVLVAHTELLLERLELAEADLAAAAAGRVGTVRVAAFQTVATALIPLALTALDGTHPDLRVEVTQREPDNSVPALVAGEFDVVVAEELPGHPAPRPREVEVAALCDDPLWLARPGSPTRRAPRVGDLAALREMPWVMEPRGTMARNWSNGVCRDAGFEPDVRFESSDPLLHLRLVETGHALAMLPALVFAGRPPTVRLERLPGDPTRRVVTVVRRGAGGHPAVRAVRTALAAAARDVGVSPRGRARSAGSPSPA